MKKQNNSLPIIIGLAICIFASVCGKMAYTSIKNAHIKPNKPEIYSVNTDTKKYSIQTKNNNIYVNETDTATNAKYQYNVNLSDSTNKFRTDTKNISSEQTKYQKQNKELVAQASKAYGFIMANDYKLVKYCSKYYPVNNLKKKYDSRFSAKKNKAESILNKAFGNNGAKDFKNAMVSNPEVINMLQSQIENDYLSVKRLAAQDGVTNFTRKQYCKMMDEEADFAVETDYKKFKTMLPNF